MSELAAIFEMLDGVEGYSEKSQFLKAVFYQMKVRKLKPADRDFLETACFRELDRAIAAVTKAENYKEKCDIFDYMDSFFMFLMKLYPSRDAIPSDKSVIVNEAMAVVKRERFLEEEIEHIFSRDTIGKYDVEHLLETLSKATDEYQRGMLYGGLLHFKDRLSICTQEAKELISDYIADEIEKSLSASEPLDRARLQNLEIACDVCRYFASDRLVSALYSALKLGNSNISFFALESLVLLGKEIPAETVEALASDEVYANMTYHMLTQSGKAALFPLDRTDPVYLAKSDLVHWLTYPTELGCPPDEIEYLGSLTSKKELYYVFKFKSESDNLAEEMKGKWLVGWSSDEGGTFSQFEPFDKYQKTTLEKTLKCIKKKAIG